MEKQTKHMAAPVLFNSKAYQSWWTKIGDVFLSRFSANYPSFYSANRRKSDEETALGYEAAWVGIARQVTKDSRIQ